MIGLNYSYSPKEWGYYLEGESVKLDLEFPNTCLFLDSWLFGDEPAILSNGNIFTFPSWDKSDAPGDVAIVPQLNINMPEVDSIDRSGDSVEYNGSEDWEIFFEDDGRIYLISKNVVSNPKLKLGKFLSLESKVNELYPLDESKGISYLSDYLKDNNRFPAAEHWLGKYIQSGFGSSEENMAWTLLLLDKNIWCYEGSEFFDKDSADWVIGSPTIEMLYDSLNTRDFGEDYSNKTKIKTTTYFVKNAFGYHCGGQYHPEDVTIDSVWNHGDSYYLSSPSNNSEEWVLDVASSGEHIYHDSPSYRNKLRPVVCLKENVKLQENMNGETNWVIVAE